MQHCETDSVSIATPSETIMETCTHVDENDKGQESFSRLDELRYDAIEKELRCLSDFHRMRQRGGFEEDETGTIVKTAGRTRILKLHHLEDFCDEDYNKAFNQDKNSESFRRFRIFNQFARSVCQIKAIARKEIFEAWAMALYVHETFLSNTAMIQRNRDIPVKRFADLVCSHGLLSWALLLLASAEEQEQETTKDSKQISTQQTTTVEKRSMSAVCVDIAMPPSSEKAAGVFFHDYPQLTNKPDDQPPSPESRWDYVEGPVENIVPHESTLLVGIHACGRLSDTIIAQAISANAPLALVPCCHSKKILNAEQKKNFKLYRADQCVPVSGVVSQSTADTLADFMDGLRTQRLVDAGYDVKQVFIPQEFSLKNRVLLAIPPPLPTKAASQAQALLNSKRPKKNWGIAYFPIPLEDSPQARATVRSIAGRAPAVERFHQAHPPPALGFNVWLPSESTTGGEEQQTAGKTTTNNFTVEALQKIMDQLRSESTPESTKDNPSGPLVKVEDVTRKIHHNPEDGRLSKTFKIHYLECRNNKERARKFHKTLKEVTIPTHFPTVTVR